MCAHVHLPGLQRGFKKYYLISEWWRSLLVNGEATSHRQRLTEGRAEEEGLGLPLPLSAKVPHRYAILLFF